MGKGAADGGISEGHRCQAGPRRIIILGKSEKKSEKRGEGPIKKGLNGRAGKNGTMRQQRGCVNGVSAFSVSF